MNSLVLSAHIDHLELVDPLTEIVSHNGAMDNGSGVALYWTWRPRFMSLPFHSVCVRYRGREGIAWLEIFRGSPHKPPPSLVSDINVDMFLPIVPLTVLEGAGLAESDLWRRGARAAESRRARTA